MNIWEVLVQKQLSFSRVPEKSPEKVPGDFSTDPSQVQCGSNEKAGEGLGGFGIQPNQVQRLPEKALEKEVLGIFGIKPGQQ